MSLSQGFPNPFIGQVTNQVTKNLNNETKKIYSDINDFMAANGHSHTGSGSDGALIKYSGLDSEVRTPIQGKNKLINVGFLVNQRGYTSGLARTSGVYAHDMWKAGSSGCTYTFTQSGAPLTAITITAGSLQQVIEGINIDGGTYALSWTGTAQGRVNGGTYSTSPLIVTSLPSGTNVTIEFNAGTLRGAQFESGTIATTLQQRSRKKEIGYCHEYAYSGTLVFTGYQAVGGGFGYYVAFPETMRATPTITFNTISYINASNLTATTISNRGFVSNAIASTNAPVNFSANYFADASL